ncbi:hypothetical protein MMPV_002245 [Pyropia vietnamensis]
MLSGSVDVCAEVAEETKGAGDTRARVESPVGSHHVHPVERPPHADDEVGEVAEGVGAAVHAKHLADEATHPRHITLDVHPRFAGGRDDTATVADNLLDAAIGGGAAAIGDMDQLATPHARK